MINIIINCGQQQVAQSRRLLAQPAQAGFARERFGYGQRGDWWGAGARLVLGVGAGVECGGDGGGVCVCVCVPACLGWLAVAGWLGELEK